MSNTATSSNETAATDAATTAPADGVLDAAAARFDAEKAAQTDASQTAAADKVAADKAAADKVAADKAVADKAAADKAEADRIAAMTPEEKAAHDKKIADEKAKDEKPEGAPEKYEDFVLPEGVKSDGATMEKLTAFAKANNLSQEKAQELVTMGADLVKNNASAQIEALKSASVEWQKQSAADKEFGGDKLDENLSVAKRAIDKFASPELRKLLGEFDPVANPGGTGLGNHPELIRAFFHIGKAISEDSVVTGSARDASAPRSAADILYGNTKK